MLREGIERLSGVVEYIREHVDSDMPVSQLAVFLDVCAHEGSTQPEIRERLGMPQTSTSRHIKVLGKYVVREGNKRVVKGLNLLRTEPDIVERRRLAVFLTERGREVMRDLEEVMAEF